MGSIWLLGLPSWFAEAGLSVSTWPGWQTRSRSSGGYDSILGIGVHHTASNTSPVNDCRFMWNTSPYRPAGALYLGRDGKWIVGAAGATNTQGRGGPLRVSRGVIPKDAGNRHVVSIEAANAGTGETWPDVQLDSYVRGCAVLCERLGLPPSDVHAHFEWTSRKIDPAGPPRYATGGNKWNMNQFRADVADALSGGLVQPDPDYPEETTDMQLVTDPETGRQWAAWAGPGGVEHVREYGTPRKGAGASMPGISIIIDEQVAKGRIVKAT